MGGFDREGAKKRTARLSDAALAMLFPRLDKSMGRVVIHSSWGLHLIVRSAYARGGDILIGAYNYLDLALKSRDETGLNHDLTGWVRHHDRYGGVSFVDPTEPWSPSLRTDLPQPGEGRGFWPGKKNQVAN